MNKNIELPALVDKIMEQAQVFASAWSLVGGPFDSGVLMEQAGEAKHELRSMVADALAAQQRVLAEQAVPATEQAEAPSDEREEIEAVIACLGDDAAQLRDENPEDERADNMDRAATLLERLIATQSTTSAAGEQS